MNAPQAPARVPLRLAEVEALTVASGLLHERADRLSDEGVAAAGSLRSLAVSIDGLLARAELEVPR